MSTTIEKIFLCSAAFAIMVCSACEKMVAIDPPINELKSEIAFSSDKLATNVLSGMYTRLAESPTQTIYLPVYNSLFADDLIYSGLNEGYIDANNNSYTIFSSLQANIFSDWYSTIYRANSIIEGLQKYQGTSDAVKKQFTAESKFFRAYSYFNLVNTFGEVPLVLTTDVSISALQPKETVPNIYKQIIADLTAAKADLLLDYSASSNAANTSNKRLGVNHYAATALLARTYLFTGDNEAAEKNASEVIAATHLYSLIPSATMATGVWVKDNLESIWQMTPPVATTNQYTNEAASFLPASGSVAQFDIRKTFRDLFASTDLRRQNWMSNSGLGATAKVLPFKYKYSTNALAVAAGVAESQTVLRLAEQYLIRAEARARIGVDLSGARADMNVIRARANATESTTTTQSELIDEILLEHRKEFFCEQGYRWYNLKRTGQADVILPALKPAYRPAAKLLPLPFSATDANPNLEQNPDYK